MENLSSIPYTGPGFSVLGKKCCVQWQQNHEIYSSDWAQGGLLLISQGLKGRLCKEAQKYSAVWQEYLHSGCCWNWQMQQVFGAFWKLCRETSQESNVN